MAHSHYHFDRLIRHTLVLVASVLAACGGGGSGSTATPIAAGNAPAPTAVSAAEPAPIPAPAPTPTPITTPAPVPAIYGPGIGGVSLANTNLGNTSVSGSISQFMRFRAEQSSPLSKIRMYYLGDKPKGYSGGTSGTWKLEVRSDDDTTNHFPTTTVLASQAFAAEAVNDAGKVFTFTTPAKLTAGKLYHLVFTNTDANPDINFWSPDYWYYDQPSTGTADGRLNPRFPSTDWAHGYYSQLDGRWIAQPGFAPILEITYASGQHQGMSYGEASYGPGEVGRINGAAFMVREQFTVSGGDKTVSGAGIRLLKVAGGTDPLTVRLEDSRGTIIDSFTIAAASIADGPAPTGTSTSWDDLGGNGKWVAGKFSAQRVLTNGATYSLRLSTASGTNYWAWVNRRLSGSGYTAATYFADGSAQKTTNGGSAWTSLGRTSGDTDLQFYFATDVKK